MAMADKVAIDHDPKARIRRHLHELLRLAPPIILARSGILLMVLVDTIMVGRHDTLELGYLAIGMSLLQPIVVTAIGLILGTLIMTANRYGAGDYAACGPIWRRSAGYAFCLGLGGLAISLFGEPVFQLTGQTDVLAREGGRVLLVLGIGMPAHLVFLASSFFLEGIGRPLPGMMFILAANILNVGLNWMLIPGLGEGVLGVAIGGGAVGAAVATTACRWLLGIGMVVYVLSLSDHQKFGLRLPAMGGWRSWSPMRRLGYASGVSLGVETFAFAAIQQFAGWLGPHPLAAFSVVFALLTTTFMAAIGISAATAVRVGNAHGRDDNLDMALAGWTGVGANTVMMAVAGVLFFVAAGPLAGLFSKEAAVIALAVPVVGWLGVVLIADGGQAVLANALRGRQDVWMPCVFQAIAYFGVMVPVCWLLVFRLEQGVAGFYQGIFIAGVVSCVLLGMRFHRLGRRAP